MRRDDYGRVPSDDYALRATIPALRSLCELLAVCGLVAGNPPEKVPIEACHPASTTATIYGCNLLEEARLWFLLVRSASNAASTKSSMCEVKMKEC